MSDVQRRTGTGPTITEPELFAAYRIPAGYSAQCACGAWIDAPSQDCVAAAVEIHNASPEHLEWRAEQDAVEALRRVPVHPCPCHGSKAS